jgi:hypothetical protein
VGLFGAAARTRVRLGSCNSSYSLVDHLFHEGLIEGQVQEEHPIPECTIDHVCDHAEVGVIAQFAASHAAFEERAQQFPSLYQQALASSASELLDRKKQTRGGDQRTLRLLVGINMSPRPTGLCARYSLANLTARPRKFSR